jgi:acyl-CoA synthetase (AMP-forming)/AMP-acid ligase II
MLARQMIKNIARNFLHKKAYICGDRFATWRDMDERSDRLASALSGLGCKKGDTVSILSLESIAVYEHFFACMKLGLIRVGVNTQYAWPEILHVLVDSSTKLLLVDARCRRIVDEHHEEIAALGIVLLGYNGEHQYPHDYEALLVTQSRDQVTQVKSHWPPLGSQDLLMYFSKVTKLSRTSSTCFSSACSHGVEAPGLKTLAHGC